MRAGVELGGTKTILVLGEGRRLVERRDVPTTTPDETIGKVVEILRGWAATHQPASLGIASFGPVSLRSDRADYGCMLATPKPGWAGVDILGPLSRALPGPVMLHTDVTAAALAEGRWGAAEGLGDFVYVTIGTGIGMGVIANGRPVTGRLHPEAGHLRVRRVAGDAFPGTCPFHGDCLEGLASGTAIAARAGRPASELAPDDPAWAPVADALAEAFVALQLVAAPLRIVVGGGVGIGQPHLLAKVRPLFAAKLAGYLPDMDEAEVARLIVPAALGGEAGPLGALALADLATRERENG